MAEKPRDEARALYIAKWSSWYWVVPEGQRSIFCGPYRSKEEAERLREDVDAKR